MKVVNAGSKSTFVPITISITFESQREVVEFMESVGDVIGEIGVGPVLETALSSIKEELSK